MDPLSPIKRFNTFQQRHNALAIPLAVIKKFGDDSAGNLAALVAYYAFFSLFPLLLVFVTILGFVLHGHAGEISRVENSVIKNFPAFGGKNGLIKFSSIKGSTVALIIGIVTSLWSGLGVTGAAQTALDTVWAVPHKHRPNFLQSKGRGLMLLISMGALFIVATALSGIVTAGFGSAFTEVIGIVISFLANIALFTFAFRFMTAKTIPTRDLRSGIVLAAIFWTILQVLGGLYVKHVLSGLTSTYGIFAVVIALFVWLHLGAQLTLYAAELNVVLRRHLYPRNLLGPPLEPADQATYAALAKVEERNPVEHVEVTFSDPEPEPREPAPLEPEPEPLAPESSG